MVKKIIVVILFVLFLVSSLTFLSCEEKEYQSNYLLPEAIETESIKVLIDDELTPYYNIVTDAYDLLVSARKINEVIIINGWMKNVTSNEYKINPTMFYMTDAQSSLLENLKPDETVNLIHGFQVPQESIPHPYLEESQNLIVTSSGSGYKIYSSPDVYTRITNEAIYLINKSKARKAAQSSLSRSQMLQDIELTIVKDSNIPPDTVKYFQIFYQSRSNAYPLDFFIKGEEALLNVGFKLPKRMAYFSNTNFTMYDFENEISMKEVIIDSMKQINQFEIVIYKYGSDIHRHVRVAGNLEDKENVEKLASVIKADYLFIPNISRTNKAGFLFTLDIYDLTNGENVFHASRNSDDMGIAIMQDEETVLFLYNEIYNELKMGIINNYGKL